MSTKWNNDGVFHLGINMAGAVSAGAYTTVLISQSRFQGETLAAVMSGMSYSRFVLAPSDTHNPNDDALQCALLGAFGGFFERGFRAHDYQLGRRNCQKFLKDHFRLATTNPIIAGGLDKLGAAERAAVTAAFDPGHTGYIPIIPVCGTAVAEVPAPGARDDHLQPGRPRPQLDCRPAPRGDEASAGERYRNWI